MDNEKPKLKPCPFCGGDNVLCVRQDHAYYGYCCECGATSGRVGVEVAEIMRGSRAIEVWNNRPADAVKERLFKALEKARKMDYHPCLDDWLEVATDIDEALAEYLEEQKK